MTTECARAAAASRAASDGPGHTQPGVSRPSHVFELDSRTSNQVEGDRHEVLAINADSVGRGERVQCCTDTALDRVFNRDDCALSAAGNYVVDCLLDVGNRLVGGTLRLGNLGQRELGKRANRPEEREGALARRVIAT